MNDDLDTASGKLPEFDALCARHRLARDHAALFPTRLALARWRGDCTPPHPQLEQHPLRAAWFDRIQRDHQAWLDRGGFAQHEELPPLRQPTMWQPPAGAPLIATEASQLRPAQDGDFQECGTCN